jgi:hypothetical protein
MKPIRFEGQTQELGKPADWDEATQGECAALPVRFDPATGFDSVWELTKSEFAALLDGGKVRLRIASAVHPPVALWIDGVERKTEVHAVVHNEMAAEIVTDVVRRVTDAGGGCVDCLVVVESVLVGVLLATGNPGADDDTIDLMVRHSKRRLAELRAKRQGQPG